MCSGSAADRFPAASSLSLLCCRGFAVTLLYGKINSEKHLEKCEHSYLAPTQVGILKVKANRPFQSLTTALCRRRLPVSHLVNHSLIGRLYLSPSLCLLQTLDEMKLELKPIKIDRRLTGSSFIDEPLQQVSECDEASSEHVYVSLTNELGEKYF